MEVHTFDWTKETALLWAKNEHERNTRTVIHGNLYSTDMWLRESLCWRTLRSEDRETSWCRIDPRRDEQTKPCLSTFKRYLVTTGSCEGKRVRLHRRQLHSNMGTKCLFSLIHSSWEGNHTDVNQMAQSLLRHRWNASCSITVQTDYKY